jgi:hypothetical protein
MESKRTQNLRSLDVVRQLLGGRMGRPINLDDKLAADRDEIDNVAIEWVLPPKFSARKPAIAEGLPKDCLSGGL